MYDQSHLHRYIENLNSMNRKLIDEKYAVSIRAIDAEFSVRLWRFAAIVQFVFVAAVIAWEVFK